MELERRNSSVNNIDGTETPKVKEAKEKMDKVARDIDKQEFEKAVNLTLEEVKKKDIEKVVETYVIKNNLPGLTDKDVEKITKDLGKTVEEKYKDIKLNNEFSNVVRDEIRDRIVQAGNYVVTDDKNQTSNTRTNLNSQGDNKDTLNKNKVHLKEDKTREEENGPIKNVITKKELEEKVDRAMKKMKQEELVDVISSALKRKDAVHREIKNPKYIKLMEKIANLRKLDKDYEDLTGNSMYQKDTVEKGKIVPKRDMDEEVEYESISGLVKKMREYLVNNINNPLYK